MFLSLQIIQFGFKRAWLELFRCYLYRQICSLRYGILSGSLARDLLCICCTANRSKGVWALADQQMVQQMLLAFVSSAYVTYGCAVLSQSAAIQSLPWKHVYGKCVGKLLTLSKSTLRSVVTPAITLSSMQHWALQLLRLSKFCRFNCSSSLPAVEQLLMQTNYWLIDWQRYVH